MLSGQPGGPRMYPRSGYFLVYTKDTFKIVENPAIVEKFMLTEQSAIVRFYCS